MKASIDVDELRAFVIVARNGSFTRAGEILKTHRAHVSRSIGRLEAKLGVRLLQRSTRSVALTAVGREVLERASAVIGLLEETELISKRTHRQPTGMLRLTCGVEFGLRVVNAWITEYLTAYPEIRVDAEFTNRHVDLINEAYDLGIRVGHLPDSALSARKLGEVRYNLYASPGYLKAQGAPAGVGDLAAHNLIMFAGEQETGWDLVNRGKTASVAAEPRFTVNQSLAIRDAAAGGVGIALLPTFQAAPLLATKKLVIVLPGWERVPQPVYAVFPSNRYLDAKTRVFVELARKLFNRTTFD